MINFNGFNQTMLTFAASEELKAGQVVNITANNTVSAVTSGNFVGIVASSSEDAASVVMTGFAELPLVGTAPALGISKVAAANGGITASDSGRTVTVLYVDSQNSKVGIIL